VVLTASPTAVQHAARPDVRRDVVLVMLLFVASRVVYKLAGVQFDASNLLQFMQILDLRQLHDHFWRSLWYLHAQPPLFNLLIGGVMNAAGDAAFNAWMGAIYSLVGLAGAICFYLLSLRLFERRWLAWVLTTFLILPPTSILYENKLYYEGLVAPMLLCGFYAFHEHLVHRRAAMGLLAFTLFAAVVLLRTAFHPAWLLLLALIPLLAGREAFLRTVKVAALPCLVVAALLVKNAVVFGSPGFSSWLGSNMARMTVETLPADLRAALIKSGRLSALSSVDVFDKPERYVALLGPSQATGVPVLDQMSKEVGGYPNYNAEVFLRVNPVLAKDSRQALLAYPQGFLKRVVTAYYHFNRPPSEFKGLEANVAHLAQVDRFYNLLLQGQPAAAWGLSTDATRPASPLLQLGLFKLAAFFATIGVCLWFAARAVRAWRQRLSPTFCFGVALSMTVAYAVLVTNVLDVWENNRARYMIDPLMTLVVVSFLCWRRSARQEHPAA